MAGILHTKALLEAAKWEKYVVFSAYANLPKLMCKPSTTFIALQGTKYYGVHLTTKSLKTPFKEADPRCGPISL